VSVDKQIVSSIGKGILVFAAIGPNDTRKDAESLAAKVLKMRIWPDESGADVGHPPTFPFFSYTYVLTFVQVEKERPGHWRRSSLWWGIWYAFVTADNFDVF